jgi:hypothetical protein
MRRIERIFLQMASEYLYSTKQMSIGAEKRVYQKYGHTNGYVKN